MVPNASLVTSPRSPRSRFVPPRGLRSLGLLGLLVLGVLGCGESPASKAPAKPAKPVDRAAILAAIDDRDGAVDHVIGKCVTCRLGMDGSEKHPVTLGEYTVRLCSSHCQKRFQSDPDAALAAVAP